MSIERHFTSNALDSGLALSDRYTPLRGSLGQAFAIGAGTARLAAAFEATQYDRFDLEDDRALSVSAETTQHLSERVEIRGTLSWRHFSEGDELIADDVLIGLRTPTNTLSAGVEVAAALGEAVLTLGAEHARERSGRTRFDHQIANARLEPDRDRLKLRAMLGKKDANRAYGFGAAGDLVHAEPLGDPPAARSHALFRLSAEAEAKLTQRTSLAAMLGAEWLRDEDRLVDSIRPTFALAAEHALLPGLNLRASLSSRFETMDTDDPLASWTRRAEMEIGIAPAERLALGAGVFAELRENMLLENEERIAGIYGEIAYSLSAPLALVVRADYTRHRESVIEIERNTLDAFVGLTYAAAHASE